ncbi:MAG: hypothetical protein QOJ85_2623, partial [Solirubrobacteraceae bacterium]|nr:hypothetical protein [Solirubrobacteraceae bacterium]
MAQPRTLRTRVTVLAVLAAAVVVALLVGAFNVVLATTLDNNVDHTLRSRAAAATTTTTVSGGRVTVHDSPNDAAIDHQVWVYEGSRAVVRPSGGAELQTAADALARRPGAFAEVTREDVRLHSVALTGDGRQVGSVVVGESVEAYDQTTDVALGGSVALGGLLLLLV